MIIESYSAGEAAAASGVGPKLQSLWRQRGLLPEHTLATRVRFTPTEVLQLAVMRQMSDAGMSVKATRAHSSMVAVRANFFLVKLDEAVAVKARGPEEIAKCRSEIDMLRMLNPERYMIIPLPEHTDAFGGTTYYLRHQLDDLPELAEAFGYLTLLIDIRSLASTVARALPRPALTMQMVEVDE